MRTILPSLPLSGLILVGSFILLGDAPTAWAEPPCGIRDDDGTPVNRCIRIELKTGSNSVGSPLTITATVTDNGVPVSGEEVRIEVASGPNVGRFTEGGLDPRGQIALTYSGAGGPGKDTVRACVVDFVEPGPCVEASRDWVGPKTTTAPAAVPSAIR